MFEREKARKLMAQIEEFLLRVRTSFDERSIALKIDDVSFESIYIALADYFLFIRKNSKMGDLLVNEFLKNRCALIPQDFMKDSLIKMHSEFHNVMKESLKKDNSETGFRAGVKSINTIIADLLGLDINNEDVSETLGWLFLTLHNYIAKLN